MAGLDDDYRSTLLESGCKCASHATNLTRDRYIVFFFLQLTVLQINNSLLHCLCMLINS